MIQADVKFDRLYLYDHMGRITSALTGIEANGGQSTDGRDLPFKEASNTTRWVI